MNLSYKELIPTNFSADSRVWIYQCNRRFTISEAIEIEEKLNEFTHNWKSHQVPVKGFGTLFFGQFIVLMADETESGVSGCSTDSSVRLIKSIEQTYNVGLFERTLLAFIIKEKIELLPISQLNYAFENNFINGETLFFDNNIQNKDSLINNWIVPVQHSWIWKRISKSVS
jgi:hypothetical protein